MGTNPSDYFMFNDSSYIMFNVTRLNETIDARDSDTIYGGVNDDWVNETGDQMSGDLNLSITPAEFVRIAAEGFINIAKKLFIGSNFYFYNNGTLNMNANMSIANGNRVIWSNGTVETGTSQYGGVNDVWVNETGDTMTGDLNINAGLNVTGNLNMTAGNIYVEEGGKTCYTSDCSVYVWYNGTNLILQG